MKKCRIVLSSSESTWISEQRKESTSDGHLMYERDYEEELIEILKSQGYEYVREKLSDAWLKNNLRKQLERLNAKRIPGFKFTDSEWRRFYSDNFEGDGNTGIVNRTKKIQGIESRKSLERDDRTHVNIDLINKESREENYLQVINQFTDQYSHNRYDVTILVNGLPLVHIELKNAGQSLQEAFQQIGRYQRDSFHKLFEFIQIFVISNGADTKYFSNTTDAANHRNPSSSDHDFKNKSFLFTTHWAYDGNQTIKHLFDFARTFLSRKTILSILTKYCVFDSSNQLKILRPYQVAAIEGIIDKIQFSINEKVTGTDAGGYIWHTTGSGKTLTSFKAAQLAKRIPQVKKVIFVVDRKALDSQTYHEYKKFLGEGSTETIDNTINTSVLRKLLNDDNERIIITTIQKLTRLLDKKHQLRESLRDERVVIIMDECHRSQTQDAHDYLTYFRQRNIFGFTGTPIWEGKQSTPIMFGECLHSYTLVDAIQDNNVLKFWVEYVGAKHNRHDKFVLSNPHRIEVIVDYIIENFERKTHPNTDGDQEVLGKTGFNSLFATSSIDDAIKYYREFQKQLKARGKNLKVAIIYSAYQDKDDSEDVNDEDDLDENQKEFLKEAKRDFEKQFSEKIISDTDYRNAISEKLKNGDIDILIVVNMFLTGFDAPCLNTLWVDKNLQDHGLIQAFSRTNRTYNRNKTHGNIVCFRDINEDVDDAIRKYSVDKHNTGNVLAFVEPFEERIKQYQDVEKKLIDQYPLDREIYGEENEREFVDLYKQFMELSQGLSCDEDFEKHRRIDPSQRKEYKSKYLGIYEKYCKRRNGSSEEGPTVHMPFDIELIKADEINIDYILNLLANYHQSKDQEHILQLVRSSPSLRREDEIILEYFSRIDNNEQIDYLEHKKQKYEERKKKVVDEEDLNEAEFNKFMDRAIKTGKLTFEGTGWDTKILPSNMPIRTHFHKRNEIARKVKEKLLDLFEIFKNIKL